jgi:hypothetical protein
MPRVLADDADDVLALHDAAAFAESLDGCSYFHGLKIWLVLEDKKSPWELMAPVRSLSVCYFCRKVILPFVKS